MSKIIGIDLGTTNTVMAAIENGEPVIIKNKRGETLTPSVVAFTKNDEILVGKTAKNQAVINSDRTIVSIKRQMGSDYKLTIGNHTYLPQDISARILKKIKEDAEEYFGHSIQQAVITVPAYFNDKQRQATKEAGKLAGLEVLRIINEPTAAALAYGLDHSLQQTILVYDLGGGTFDVSILEIDEGVFEVKATSGNNQLGGDDFDLSLMNLLIKQYKEKEKIDLTTDKMAMQKLREEVEKAKIELSERQEVEINIPFISADQNGPKHLYMEIKRSQFEDLISEYIDETIRLTEKVMVDAGCIHSDIDEILLVGGSTRIPLVQRRVKEILKKDVLKGINPDECVALGASVQAGILSGENKGIVLVDVTPLSLGIEIEGGIFIPIIKRNSTIPTTANKMFTTVSDNQKSVEIHVLQGERARCVENTSLGKFQLSGIRNAPKGLPRIDVTFNIDVDGIVHVQARDLDTNVQHQIVIQDAHEIDEKEIHRIVLESEKFQTEDKQYIENQKKRNTVERLMEEVQFLFQKHGNELSQEIKKDVEQLLSSSTKDYMNVSGTHLDEINDSLEFVLGELKSELAKHQFESAASM